MSLSTLDYLNLSAVAYLDFDKLAIGKNIAQLIGDKVISEKDINSPELSALQDPSNPLRSWIAGINEKKLLLTLSPFLVLLFKTPKQVR